MLPPDWQLKTPLDAIVFDCDGTLSTIEGIDQLAEFHGAGDAVRELTATAMGKTGLTPDIYQERLDLILPTRQLMDKLGQQYCKNLTPDSQDVIRLLQRLGKPIYIVSAGLTPAIAILAEQLHIPQNHIYAVNIEFDSEGKFCHYEHDSPLVQNAGKKIIVTALLKKHPRIGYIGDGLNDVVVRDLVTRFIGYGGIYYRSNIEALCDFYITTPSMTGVLPLLLTQSEVEGLSVAEKSLYNQGAARLIT
ncbi:MAG TPA: HAD-IB family phosphatase [Gammaproteobacteria bacterium]|nr:HAD-IB family phosphatase [Gammaproteobacteria bacterium]